MVKKEMLIEAITKIWKVTPKLLKSSFQTSHSKRKSRIPWMISWPNASQTVSGKKDFGTFEQNYRGLPIILTSLAIQARAMFS